PPPLTFPRRGGKRIVSRLLTQHSSSTPSCCQPQVPLENRSAINSNLSQYSDDSVGWAESSRPTAPERWVSKTRPTLRNDRHIAESGKQKTWIILFFSCAALIAFIRLDAPLQEPQEVRYAEIPRQMLAEGKWLVPVLHGEPYLHKPPLLYWL